MFTSKINTLTGHTEWEVQNEDYDYQQELARAGFADMLHDYERVYIIIIIYIYYNKINYTYYNHLIIKE